MNNLTAPPATDLRSETLEHVMRCCDDELALETFAATAPGSPAAAIALGRLMADHPHAAIVPGSPLTAWVSGARLNPAWRTACPAPTTSLYGEYEFLCAIYGTPLAGAYDGLTQLREHAAQDVLSVA